MSIHAGRTGKTISDTTVFQAIQQILFENPEMKDNLWLSHRIQMITAIEDEGERAPPLSSIFEDEASPVSGSGEKTDLNVIELMRYKPYFFIRRVR